MNDANSHHHMPSKPVSPRYIERAIQSYGYPNMLPEASEAIVAAHRQLCNLITAAIDGEAIPAADVPGDTPKTTYRVPIPHRERWTEVYGALEMEWYKWRTVTSTDAVLQDTQKHGYGTAKIAPHNALIEASVDQPLPNPRKPGCLARTFPWYGCHQ